MMNNTRSTKDRILDAANLLFYAEGIRAVSVDAIAQKAKITKRTLYYHFKSKDELITSYLASRDQPNLALFEKWFSEAENPLANKVETIFKNLAHAAKHPKWKGCGFLRTSAELANQPGHPALKVGAAHKKKFEAWLTHAFETEGLVNSPSLARQIIILMDGSFSTMLVHRDPAYIEAAGKAAKALITIQQMPRSRTTSLHQF